MFDRLIHFSIHNKLIGLLTLALVAWDSYSLSRLPIDALPDITSNQVVVYTVAPSLAAQEIERLVSFPVEQAMVTIPCHFEKSNSGTRLCCQMASIDYCLGSL